MSRRRTRRRRSHRTQSRLTLITVVGLFLAAVLLADHLGLTNHA
jgi:hypothetical protein